jgi:hypothetical protein
VSKRPGSPSRYPAARLAGLAGILACTLLSGCSSVSHTVADNWPRMLGGLPEGVPPRSDNPPAYMPVQVPAPQRDTKPMTADERKKMEAEMAASRGQNTNQAEELKTQAPSRLPPIH